mgnify:CR=1 FL=1
MYKEKEPNGSSGWNRFEIGERFENALKNYGVLGKIFFPDEIFKLFVHNVSQNFPGICYLSDMDIKIEKFP